MFCGSWVLDAEGEGVKCGSGGDGGVAGVTGDVVVLSGVVGMLMEGLAVFVGLLLTLLFSTGAPCVWVVLESTMRVFLKSVLIEQLQFFEQHLHDIVLLSTEVLVSLNLKPL